jgi:ABC-type glycerol-3-phosphate transport system substrate-binding protein
MKITQRDDSNSVRRATIAFGEYRNVSHAKDILSLLILQAGGPITRFSDGDLTPVLGGKSATVQQPAESALRFFAEFANPANAYYTWNRAQKSSREAFTGGTLALYLGPASEEPLIRQLNPNLDFAVAAVPQIESKEYKTNYGNVYGFAVSRTSDNPQGALSAVYLLAASKSSRLFSQALGIPSARRDVLAEKASGLDDLFNKQAIIAVGWVDPHPQKTDEIFRDMIESITSGSAKLSEAIQRAEEAMGKIITEQ